MGGTIPLLHGSYNVGRVCEMYNTATARHMAVLLSFCPALTSIHNNKYMWGCLIGGHEAEEQEIEGVAEEEEQFVENERMKIVILRKNS